MAARAFSAAVALVAVALMVGCGQGGGERASGADAHPRPTPGAAPVSLALGVSVARPGQVLRPVIENRSGATLSFSPGCLTLERRDGAHWRKVTRTHGAALVCGRVLERARGQRVPDPYTLPSDLAPGRYRLTLAYTLPTGSRLGAARHVARARLTVHG